MRINRDDPKWTAYVLGELGDVERTEIAQLLESSEEAREFVEELQLATTMLKEEFAEFAQAQAPALLPEQRRAIHAAATRTKPGSGAPWFRVRPAVAAVGLAASIFTIAAITIPQLIRSRPGPQVTIGGPVRATDQASNEGPAQASTQTSNLTSGPEETRYKAAPTVRYDPNAPDETSGTLPEAQSAAATVRSEEKNQPLEAFAREVVSPAVAGPQSGQLSGVLGGVLRQRENEAAPPPPPSAPRLVRPGPGGALVVVPPAQNYDQAFVMPVAPDRRNRPNAPPFQTETYDRITDNPFLRVSENPLSTFSIDVDTASYANMRRFLTQGQMPPKDAVRIEEMVNYFSYDYPQPTGEHPIAAQMEVASAPWNPQHRLVRIAIKGREMDLRRRPSSNLVFLIDVSGSMQPPEKLPLLKSAMKLLVDKLTENDRVSIVVYAGASGTALQPTSGDKKEIIMDAIDRLQASGSTNGASGIQLAYDMAVSNFIPGGVNRVILATDGDFNVGVTNQGDLTRLIEDKAKSGVFLSVFGFGMGNLKDSTLEKLADTGNGNYAYIDSINEARKVLVEEMGATLVTIAKDVKIQVEFNPTQVGAYRLIGYENRLLRDQDFNDDQKDAGDMGSGHTVTALFEVVPPGVDIAAPGVDPLKYQAAPASAAASRAASSREMLNLKIRYKQPDGSQSKLLETPLVDRGGSFVNATTDFRFAASVAAFGMVLRDSPYKGDIGLDAILGLAQQSRGADRGGYRAEFMELIRQARRIRR